MNPCDPIVPGDTWRVICLCAQWCGVCREWQVLFQQVGAAYPQLQFAWVDIEDQADAVGEVEIETFPTLLIARGLEPRFYGPVQPSAGQFRRLLDSLMADPAAGSPPAAEARTLLQRLAAIRSQAG